MKFTVIHVWFCLMIMPLGIGYLEGADGISRLGTVEG